MESFESIQSLGVGGLFAILIIKMILDFVKSTRKKPEDGEFKKQWAEHYRMQKDLHEWHSATDPNTGLKLWYEDRKLLKVIEELSINIKEQTKALNTIATEGKLNANALKVISQDIHEMRNRGMQ